VVQTEKENIQTDTLNI